MEKAVLVIDMPTKCDECRFHYKTYDENDYYIDKCELLNDMTIDGYTKKYDGCPLKSVNQIVDRLEQQVHQYKRRSHEVVDKNTEAGIHNFGKACSYEHAVKIVKEELK